MASSAPASTVLQSLVQLPRPPTPPRDANTYDSRLDPSSSTRPHRPSPLNPQHSLHTPPNVSVSASAVDTTNSNGSSTAQRKRVGWSGQNEYYKDPLEHQIKGKPYKSSPLSSARPVKGILKATSSPVSLNSSFAVQLNGQTHQINITEMLDSTIKQLAGTDRDSKRDAYMTLSRALKASNNLPDRVALQDKMSLFMQFIQRDITTKDENNSADTSLVNHALTLLATFLQFPAIATTITTDFAIFIVDYCIRSFDDPSSSKDAVRHFMQVVAFQNFPPKVMTLDRVGRLVSSLHSIENHHAGKSIVMKRIHIYKKLMAQARNHMTVHSEWLKDVFTDMLSSIKEIQNQAINLGMDAGYVFRPSAQMSRKALEILQTVNDDQTYIEFYVQRLQEMVKEKARSTAVPKIWSVIIAFLRFPLDKWEFYAPWLTLIQAAFNSSDINTKLEANYAWNRYAYITLVHNGVSPKALTALCQPLLSQLKRKHYPRSAEDGVRLRKTVIGGICSLYYYAFRPGHDRTPNLPETIWDQAVYPVMAQLLGLDGTQGSRRPDDILQASRILVGLLNVSTPVVWREDRVMDLPPVKPDELPSIESKWIRRNSVRIFKVVRPILEERFADLANKEGLIYRLWSCLVGSIGAASAKDIKVSEDTVLFLAGMLEILSKTWAKGCPEDDALLASKFYSSVQVFVTTAVKAITVLPFTEKQLSMTVSNTFEPVATPSQRNNRPEKSRGVVRTPLSHIFTLLSSVPEGGADNAEYAAFFQSTFEPFLEAKNARAGFDIKKEFLRLIPPNTLSPYGPWLLGAQGIRDSLAKSTPHASGGDKILWPELREITSFLERGITLHPHLPMDSWLSLFEPFSDSIVERLGDAGRALVITEPLAKVLHDSFPPSTPQSMARTLDLISTIAGTAKLPRDKQALAVARRKLWGPMPLHKSGLSDPFEHLPKLLNLTMRHCYDNFTQYESTIPQIARLLSTLGTFLQNTYSGVGLAHLDKLTEGISPWLEDEKTVLVLAHESPIGDSLRQLWSQICDHLVSLGRLDSQQFDQVDGLVSSAFKSKHRFIVNKTAETWNSLLKEEEVLRCSDSLKSIVSSLRSVVDLVIPSHDASDGDFGAQTTAFVESQEVVVLSTGSSHENESLSAPVTAPKKSSPILAIKKRVRDLASESSREYLAQSPPSKRTTRSSRTSTPRLRHDDSQIQFEPITDLPSALEESQHFTERQREIRERQQENALVYSDIHETSPIRAVDTSPKHGPADIPSEKGEELPVNNTPERASTYQELISSTPTPRRGQFIAMEGDNDPPSSPLEPRPYPLLSEIRSRSRASSSLENWEFSSPPSSPVTSRQQVGPEADPLLISMTDDSTQAKMVTPTRSRLARGAKKSAKALATTHKVAKRTEVTEDTVTTLDVPQTPQRPPSTYQLPESPRSGEDEFVDARSNMGRSSPLPDNTLPHNVTSKDTSFALSEGDESRMMKFVVELETRNGDHTLYEKVNESPDKIIQECITVRADSSSEDEASEVTGAEPMHEIIPSTPLDESIESSTSSKRGKRKRGSKAPESRRKKRKSTGTTESSQNEGGGESLSEHANSSSRRAMASESPIGVRTRRSLRKEQERQQEIHRNPEVKEEGDTDEELMSQIIGESYAASSSQQANTPQSELPSVIEDSVDNGESQKGILDASQGPDVITPEEEERKGDNADHIVEMLKGGVSTLRQVSLSRAEVNKIEDMLMDMKRALYAAEQRGRESP